MTMAEVLETGELDGYQPLPPPNSGIGVEGTAIDEDLCATGTCSNCGHVGMTYTPYSKRTGERNWFSGGPCYSYRAFAVCPECGHAEEF